MLRVERQRAHFNSSSIAASRINSKPYFSDTERYRLQYCLSALQQLSPKARERLVKAPFGASIQEELLERLQALRKSITGAEKFAYTELVGALLNLSPQDVWGLPTYTSCSILDHSCLKWLLSGFSQRPLGSMRIEQNVASLPVLKIVLDESRLQVHRFDRNGARNILYDKEYDAQFELEGFAECRLLFNQGEISIEAETTALQIVIESSIPIRLVQDLKIQGNVTVLASEIVVAAVIGSSAGYVHLKAEALEHESDLIQGQAGVTLEAKDLQILYPVQSDTTIHIIHGGGDCYIDNEQLSTPGLLQFEWLGNIILDEVYANPHGALQHQASGSLTVLSNQRAETDCILIAGGALVLGNRTHNPDLAARQGYVRLSGYTLQGSQAVLTGNAGIILSGKNGVHLGQMDKVHAVELMSAGAIQFESDAQVVWLQINLITKDLIIKGSELDNVSSRVVVMGDGHFQVKCNQHRLQFIEDARGHSEPAPDSYAISSTRQWGPLKKATSAQGVLQVHGRLMVNGQTKILGSTVHFGAFSGEQPIAENFVGYSYASRTSWYGNPGKAWPKSWSENSTSVIPTVFSLAGELDAKAPNLQVSAVVTAVGIHLREIASGRVGLVDLNIKLPELKSYESLLNLSGNAQSSQLFQRSLSGQSIFQARLAAFNVEPSLAPIVVLGADNQVRLNTQGLRKLYPFFVEQSLLLQGLLEILQQGFLSANLTNPEQIFAFLRVEAEQCLQDPIACAQIRAEGIRAHGRPMLVYTERRVQFADGTSELGLEPVVYLPEKLFNNLRKRYGEGGLFSLEGIKLTAADENSVLHISGVLEANQHITVKNFTDLNIIRSSVSEGRWVTDEHKSRGMLGMGRKKHTEQRYVVDVTPQLGAGLISREGTITLEANNLRTEGAVFAAHTSVEFNTNDYRQTESLARKHRAVPDTKCSLGGKMVSTVHVAEEQYMPTQVFTPQFRIEAKTVYADALVSSHPPIILADIVVQNHAGRLRQEARLLQESIRREAKRTARRKQRTSMFLMVVPIVVTAGSSTLLTSAGLLVEGSVKLALVQGAIMGGTSALVSGCNPIQGVAEGALFGGLGYKVAGLLGEGKGFVEVATKGSIRNIAVATGQTLLHGGNLGENLLAAIATGIASAPFELKTVDHLGSQIALASTQGAVVGFTIIALTGSDDYAANLMAATLGAALQPLGNKIGKSLAERVVAKPSVAPVDESVFIEALQAHPALQGTESQVQERLIALGQYQAPELSSAEALKRGTQQVLMSVLSALVPEAQAAENASNKESLRDGPNFTEKATLTLGSLTGMAASVARVIPNVIEILTDAGTVMDGLLNPHLQDAAYQEAFEHQRAFGEALCHPIDTLEISIGQRLQQARQSYEQKHYFLAGYERGELVGDVGLAATGAIGGAKLLFSFGKVATKTTAGGLKLVSTRASEFAAVRYLKTFQFNQQNVAGKVGNAGRALQGADKPLTFGYRSSPKSRLTSSNQYAHSPTDLLSSTYLKGVRGEQAALKALEKLGFEFKPSKLPGNRGFDHIAVRYGASGEVNDILIIESKFSSTGRVSLSQTAGKGKQMGPEWIDTTLEDMIKRGGEVRKTASLIRDNFGNVKLKGNILDHRGLNRWKPLSEQISKLQSK